MRRHTIVFLLITALFAAGCASKKVLVPPRIDLTRFGTLGMVAFSSNGADDLAEIATARFQAVLQSAQPGVPILELGDSSRVLKSVKHEEIDLESIKAIGKKYGVDAVIVGELTTEQAKPSFSLSSVIESLSASVDVEGVLSARILQTRSGATIWRNAARGTQNVARMSLAGGARPQIGGRDPDDAESQLVQSLVGTLTQDFRSQWVKQR